jgi:spore germination protein
VSETTKTRITDLQLFALIVTAVLDANLLFLPRVSAQNTGRDGWLSIIAGGLVILATAAVVYLLCRRFPNRILPEFSILIAGKPIGILIALLFTLYTLILAGITLRLFTEAAKTWVMQWTPQAVFMLLMLLPAVNIVKHGPSTLARIAELFLIAFGVAALFALVPIGQFSFINLKPVGQAGMMALTKSIPDTLSHYRGFEILVVLFPLVVNRKNVFRLYMAAIVLIVMVSAGSAILIYGVTGIEHTQIQAWPVLEYMASEQLQILDRVDNLFLFFWTFQIIGLIAVQYFAAVTTVSRLFKKNYYPIWTLVLWPLVYVLATIPHNQHSVFKIARVIGIWGHVFILGLASLLLLTAVIRGLDERTEGE